MSKITKRDGYLIEIKVFIAADLSDMALLPDIQKARKDALSVLDTFPDRAEVIKSSLETTRR